MAIHRQLDVAIHPQVHVDVPTAAALLRGLQAGSHASAARAVIDVLASPMGGHRPQASMIKLKSIND